MKRLPHYFRHQTLVPLILSLAALSVLALLTQSLSTIDLIVENRQSTMTFLYITVLALPQLLGIILPFALFMAALYALNKLNTDSEMVVAKAAGFSPWQLASPVLRVACYALLGHLIINLWLQPFAQQQMRSAVYDVRADLAAQLVRPGEFYTPTTGLTVYASETLPSGQMKNVLIYDVRNPDSPATYTAKSGVISKADENTSLIMRDGNVQYSDASKDVRIVKFDDYQFSLSEIMQVSTSLRLKAPDQYLHQLFQPIPTGADTSEIKRIRSFHAEGHTRLATPLYNIALVMIAVCFLVRGEFQRMGYGRRIALAALLGFFIRLTGFAMASTAESDPDLNIFQYGIPVATIIVCAIYMMNRTQKPNLFDPDGFAPNESFDRKRPFVRSPS